MKKKIVYVGLSLDIIHHGHINLIQKASNYGDLIVGLITDKAISSYKRIPLLDYNSRKNNSNATKVIYIAKIKTTIQLFTISVYLFALAFNFMILIPIADLFLIISTLITLYTGYLYTFNTFKS